MRELVRDDVESGRERLEEFAAVAVVHAAAVPERVVVGLTEVHGREHRCAVAVDRVPRMDLLVIIEHDTGVDVGVDGGARVKSAGQCLQRVRSTVLTRVVSHFEDQAGSQRAIYVSEVVGFDLAVREARTCKQACLATREPHTP